MDIRIQNTVGEMFEVSIPNKLTVAQLCAEYAAEMELEDVETWAVEITFADGEKKSLAADAVIVAEIRNPLVDYFVLGPEGSENLFE